MRGNRSSKYSTTNKYKEFFTNRLVFPCATVGAYNLRNSYKWLSIHFNSKHGCSANTWYYQPPFTWVRSNRLGCTTDQRHLLSFSTTQKARHVNNRKKRKKDTKNFPFHNIISTSIPIGLEPVFTYIPLWSLEVTPRHAGQQNQVFTYTCRAR